jgi:hypothetical protein
MDEIKKYWTEPINIVKPVHDHNELGAYAAVDLCKTRDEKRDQLDCGKLGPKQSRLEQTR